MDYLFTATGGVLPAADFCVLSEFAFIWLAGSLSGKANTYFGFCFALHKIKSDGVTTFIMPLME